MYAGQYNLSGRPFQLSPDHRFFFDSASHQKALAYLTFGLAEREGFIVITGEIGAGKTTLVRHLLSQISRDDYVSASVVTTQLEADDALRMVASSFGLPFSGIDKATLLRSIESFFVDCHARGKHVLLVVDEVQNMPFSALEELRMLSNFQYESQPLFQCFLLGQPEFRRMIASDKLEQLRQRVIASCHLEPLSESETRDYIEHRLRMVGWTGDPDFDDESYKLIYRYTDGVPRRINALCGRIMLYGSLEDVHHIDGTLVREVVDELTAERGPLMGKDLAPLPAPMLRPAPPETPPRGAPQAVPIVHPAPVVKAAAPAPVVPSGPPLPLQQSLAEEAVYDETIEELMRRVAALKGSR